MEHAVKLKVDGESQLVKLSEMAHPVHCMFHVQFEDGYENIFFTDIERKKWIEQDVGFSDLAQQVGKQIANLYHFNWVTRDVEWYSENEVDTILQFGYSRNTSGGYLVYEIFAANRRYMFTLVRLQNHVWQLFKIPGSGWDYKQEYVQRIPFILEELGL